MSEHALGDGPVEETYKETMKAVAQAIDVMFNGEDPNVKTTGFILMVFPFEDGKGELGRCNYMSNASRADVVVMLKEQLKRFEGQAHVVGRA